MQEVFEYPHKSNLEGFCCRNWLGCIEITDATSKSTAADQSLDYSSNIKTILTYLTFSLFCPQYYIQST